MQHDSLFEVSNSWWKQIYVYILYRNIHMLYFGFWNFHKSCSIFLLKSIGTYVFLCYGFFFINHFTGVRTGSFNKLLRSHQIQSPCWKELGKADWKPLYFLVYMLSFKRSLRFYVILSNCSFKLKTNWTCFGNSLWCLNNHRIRIPERIM